MAPDHDQGGSTHDMIDNLALLLSHGLLLLACWRLLSRDDLDDEDAGTAASSIAEEPRADA